MKSPNNIAKQNITFEYEGEKYQISYIDMDSNLVFCKNYNSNDPKQCRTFSADIIKKILEKRKA